MAYDGIYIFPVLPYYRTTLKNATALPMVRISDAFLAMGVLMFLVFPFGVGAPGGFLFFTVSI